MPKNICFLTDWASQWRNNANFDSQKQAFGIWRKVRKLVLCKQNLKASQSLLNSSIRICFKIKNANEKMLLFGKKPTNNFWKITQEFPDLYYSWVPS